MRNKVNITQDPVNRVLVNLTLPMIMGVLGIVMFNLADTYFVGKLGTLQIAALSFTFPIVMILNSIVLGIGIGTSVLISKAVGQKKTELIKRLATDSMSLGICIAVVIMIVGLFTIEPLFTLLGADSETLPYIVDYMRIWYLGVPFVCIPMIGNSAIRALGDTKTPGMVMLVGSIVNIIMDPLLIMGVGFFPAMGVQGAAVATLCSRAITLIVGFYVLVIREKVILFQWVGMKPVLQSWKSILFIGIPNAVARMIVPVGTGIITGLVAGYGAEAVAGYGIATKVEFFAISVMSAFVSVIPIYVGQNFGAKKWDRIIAGFRSGQIFSILNGLIMYTLLALLARPIAHLFTQDESVIATTVLYFRVVPIGYAFMSMVQLVSGFYNALHKPFKAASINVIQMIIVYVPLAVISSKYLGIVGIFGSLAASYLLVAIISRLILKKDMGKMAIAIQTEEQ